MRVLQFFSKNKVDYQQFAERISILSVATQGEFHGAEEVRTQLTRAVLRTWPKVCSSNKFALSLLDQAARDWEVALRQPSLCCQPACLFERILDQRIQECLCTGTLQAQQAIENLLAQWYAPIADTKEARHRLQAAEGREDAFSMAFTKFLARLRATHYTGAQPAKLRTLFEKIFLDECTSHLRNRGAHKNKLLDLKAGKDENGQEIAAVFDRPYHTDPLLLADSLALLRRHDPDCYDLIELHYSGYPYEEIAQIVPIFAHKSPEQLKKKACKCKDKLQSYWNRM